MNKTLLSVVAGVALGLLWTASPLTIVTLTATVPVIVLAGRGLPAPERRLITGIVVAALAARALLIVGLLIAGIPAHTDLAVGSLGGDDAYYLSRAMRARDILLGYTAGKYDYFVVTDEYGRTSYLSFLGAVQVVFGPTPFSMRLLNSLAFVGGALMLFRTARRAFGPTPAIAGLVAILFLPSLLWSSVSLLKESAYFLFAALLLYCAARIFRARRRAEIVTLIAASALSLFILDDLRRGALVLVGSGLAVAMVLRVAASTPARLATALAAAIVIGGVALTQPSIQTRALGAIASAAKVQGGHVFTTGHAYKLLDQGFYRNPNTAAAWQLDLTPGQAARFVIRAAWSFIITPWPWEMRSLGELAYLPEHLLWYLMIIGLPAGIIAGWQRDPTTTALLIGYALPTAAALALTNGNVGTLLRLRGLVTPYLLWIGLLGLVTMAHCALAARSTAVSGPAPAWGLEGHTT